MLATDKRIAADELWGSSASGGEVTIGPYAEACERWRIAVRNSPAATLYHDPRWIDALRDSYRLPILVARMALPEGEEALCVMARPRLRFKDRLVALPFSDACPPLAPCAPAAQALLRGLVEMPGAAALEVRGLSAPAPWRVVSTFSLWELNVNRPLARLRQGFTVNFRRNLKKAAKNGVEFEVGDSPALIARFFALHFNSRHHQGLPAQPHRFFRLLGERFRPARAIEIWIATRGGQDVAAVLLLQAGKRLYYKWAAREPGENLGASHLLLWHIVERAANEFEVLDLGRADVRNAGLSRFKSELGAAASRLPYSFAPDAPRNISSERLIGARLVISQAWRRLPAAIARRLGGAIYGLLS